MAVLIQIVEKHRSKFLMCVLIALQLASPLADSNPHAGGVIALLVLLSLLAAASYMANRRIVRLLVMPLVGIWLLARAVETFSHKTDTHWAPVAGLALSCALLWAILDRFNAHPLVTGNVIAEAFIAYVILAIAFSQLYWILNRLLDNAFNQPITASDTSILLYFSMITLTSVGYGRIVPMNPYVRLVAAVESMIGIFFIAVVVARLVSSSYGRPRE